MKTFDIIAIDVVILPPKEVSKVARELNGRIKNRYFSLGTADFRPHMTLSMAYVDNLDRVLQILTDIAAQTEPFKVVFNKITSKEMSPGWGGGKIQNSWNAEASENLSGLHNVIVKSLPSIDTPKEPEKSFVDGKNVSRQAMEYVANFRFNNSGENYWPHVTLGNGENKLDQTFRREFLCREIVLAQLGDFCTVRKILGRFKLGK